MSVMVSGCKKSIAKPPYVYRNLITYFFYYFLVLMDFSLTHHPRNLGGPRWTLGMRAIENLIDFKTPFFDEKTPKAEVKKVITKSIC